MAAPVPRGAQARLDLAWAHVPPPWRARRLARRVLAILLVFAALLVFAPWVQNVSGEGRVIAYAPGEREQTVDAPISGRVVEWHVIEGQVVESGQLLAELADNDPELESRLERQRDALVERVRALERRFEGLAGRVDAVAGAGRDRARAAEERVRLLEQRVGMERARVEAAKAAEETARLNVTRVAGLRAEGLASERDLELARLGETETTMARRSADAALAAAVADQASAVASAAEARLDADARVDEAHAMVRSAEAELLAARMSLESAEADLVRQRMRRVTAPVAGMVLRILVRTGGAQVKAQDPLLVLIPTTEQRAIEVWVDGNDAAIIDAGRKVRLQFEGWPAVQWSGWPRAAVGTYGGEVAFVDAQGDGQGHFRVVVLPDPEDVEWPERRFLRQGVRVKAWFLLDEVRLGFELWRRFNGFPPAFRSFEAAASSNGKPEGEKK